MLLTGCQTTREFPDWQGESVDETATTPMAKCKWPDIVDVDGGGFLDTPALSQLDQCREVATTNHNVAALNAKAINRLLAAYNKTNIQGGKYVELAEFQLNELERARRDAEVEGWAYKGLLAVVLIAVSL